LDNLPARKGEMMRRWAKKNQVELCFTRPTRPGPNPIEAHFGQLSQFTVTDSHHPNHTVQNRALDAYLRWRNANARHPTCSPPSDANAPASAAKGHPLGGRPIAAAA
jgi:hypothetical protein